MGTLLFLALIVLTSSDAVTSEPPAAERTALLTFISQVRHLNRIQWNSTAGSSTCDWTGVKCDPGKTSVVELHLPAVGLVGPIPPNSLGLLPNLRILSLRHNAIVGPIPDDLSNLSRLFSLCLQDNAIAGGFPRSITKLTHLSRLNLSRNKLSGEIPFALNNLSRLTVLYLDHNNFSGKLPSINITTLGSFNVSFNSLNGSIPQTLARFPAASLAGNINLCGDPLPPCSPFFPSPSPSPAISPPAPESKKKKLSTGAIIAIVAGVVGFLIILLLLLLLCCFARRKKAEKSGDKAAKAAGTAAAPASSAGVRETGMTSSSKDEMSGVVEGGRNRLAFVGKGGAYSFDLEDLLRASAEVLGKGSVGTSYKAILEEGTTVVVKRLKDVSASKREFELQMEEIGRIDHQNLLPLRAYYYSKDEKLLVFDYLPAGSLSSMLHGFHNMEEAGPVSNEVLYDQAHHRSSRIEEGQEPVKVCDHGNRHSSWVVDERADALIEQSGLNICAKLRWIRLDHALLTALVERWRPETNTFHMRQGEMTITLQDVAVITGLPIAGVAIWQGPRHSPWGELMSRLLGQDNAMARTGGLVKLTWLRDTFSELSEEATVEEIQQYTRAYLLNMIGTLLVPDGSKGSVHLRWLSLLENFDQIRGYAWGSAVLAHMYSELGRVARGEVNTLYVCGILLQVWSWERFYIGRPTYQVNALNGQLPLGRKWDVPKTFRYTSQGNLDTYRDQFDMLEPTQVNWQPYVHDLWDLPLICLAHSEIWRARVPIFCWDELEMHVPDRVMRQFGLRQHIPLPLPALPVKKNLTPREWVNATVDPLDKWMHRENHIAQEGAVVSEYEYLKWYWGITRRWIFTSQHAPFAQMPRGPVERSHTSTLLEIYKMAETGWNTKDHTYFKAIQGKIDEVLQRTRHLPDDVDPIELGLFHGVGGSDTPQDFGTSQPSGSHVFDTVQHTRGHDVGTSSWEPWPVQSETGWYVRQETGWEVHGSWQHYQPGCEDPNLWRQQQQQHMGCAEEEYAGAVHTEVDVGPSQPPYIGGDEDSSQTQHTHVHDDEPAPQLDDDPSQLDDEPTPTAIKKGQSYSKIFSRKKWFRRGR